MKWDIESSWYMSLIALMLCWLAVLVFGHCDMEVAQWIATGVWCIAALVWLVLFIIILVLRK